MAKTGDLKPFVGLEVGTSKVVVVVGEILPDGVINVIGVGNCPSKGINKGSITDLDAVVHSIQRAVEAAESVSDCQISSVTLAITGEHIVGLNESGQASLPDGEVTQDEIDHAMNVARSVKIGDGLTVLHVIPQEYAVDKQVNIKNPLGLQGMRLTAQAHLIACHQDWLTNLKKAVERCNLKVDQIVFSGLASSYSVLSEEEKELGVCLVDIGGGTMDIMVYTNGALRYTKVIPYAGNIVTNDVAQGIVTSRTDAENIKVNYGCAIDLSYRQDDEQYDYLEPKKVISVPSIGGRPPRSMKKADLSLIIGSRYGEMLGWVKQELTELKQELQAKKIPSDLIAGIVLTGGGAQIKGIVERANETFGSQIQVRLGSPLNITGLTDYVNKPQNATVLGLLQYRYHHSDDDGISGTKSTELSKKSLKNFGKEIFRIIKGSF
ncbi:cell division protein FtsA [Mergibacter septicus]|uniref:Cell division protein FtsA n=1 Tax=Mergibacter septicus TaxID=221402 RepID=A0A8E3MFE6_9PAST|nr:cell division protein FtsA [Mergibacter septicus]AWX14998.1 cell division protein FtsA [Mergibacter septicus]QDJ12434.1 cell division protein FtsA [Mergibacter septicus]QDJ14250.1 cell division protein FtsA [Mergibacter septicus]UTU48305.1 cell division protein FtsA [Mergibacter septicus]WMR96072.1 cell division protein FtsA [Mergibacter septicus]